MRNLPVFTFFSYNLILVKHIYHRQTKNFQFLAQLIFELSENEVLILLTQIPNLRHCCTFSASVSLHVLVERAIKSNVDIFTEPADNVLSFAQTCTAFEKQMIRSACMEHRIENGSNPPILLRSSLINILDPCHFCNKRTPLINAVILQL